MLLCRLVHSRKLEKNILLLFQELLKSKSVLEHDERLKIQSEQIDREKCMESRIRILPLI